MRRSVAAVAVSEGKVFVARRVEGGELSLKWEFPGGKVEARESDRKALVREFDEEFGAAIRPVRVLGEAGFMHHGSERRLSAWLVELSPDASLDLREHTETAWLSPDELAALDLADSDRLLLPFVMPLLA